MPHIDERIKQWLKDLMVREVSTVGRAANRRRFLVLKGDTEMFDEIKALEAIQRLDEDGMGAAITLLEGKDLDVTDALLKDANLSEGDALKVKAALRVLGPDLAAMLPDLLEKQKFTPGKNTGAAAKRLIQGLMDSGMTQEEIGSKVDRSPGVISGILNGTIANPPEELISALRAIKKEDKTMTDEEKAAAAKAEAEKVAKAEEDEKDRGLLRKLAKLFGAGVEKDDDLDGLPDGVSVVLKAERAAAKVERDAAAEREKTLQEKIEKADKRVTDLETANRLSAAIQKCAKDYGKLPGAADDFASVLMSIQDNCTKEDVEKLEAVLKSASTAIEKSDLFKQLSGKAGIQAGSAEEEMNGLADKMVEKADKGTLTREAAIVEIAKSNPDLYERHVEEQRAAARQ